jgi:hypothetical protein
MEPFSGIDHSHLESIHLDYHLYRWAAIFFSLRFSSISTAYDKRKYMWKLLYTKMLGYDVDFGQKQSMDLIASNG